MTRTPQTSEDEEWEDDLFIFDAECHWCKIARPCMAIPEQEWEYWCKNCFYSYKIWLDMARNQILNLILFLIIPALALNAFWDDPHWLFIAGCAYIGGLGAGKYLANSDDSN